VVIALKHPGFKGEDKLNGRIDNIYYDIYVFTYDLQFNNQPTRRDNINISSILREAGYKEPERNVLQAVEIAKKLSNNYNVTYKKTPDPNKKGFWSLFYV